MTIGVFMVSACPVLLGRNLRMANPEARLSEIEKVFKIRQLSNVPISVIENSPDNTRIFMPG